MREIDNHAEFKEWISREEQDLPAVAVQALSIAEYEDELMQKKFMDSLFLGCTMSDNLAGHIVKTGGTVIRNSDKMKFKTHRAHLYTPDDLFQGFDINAENGYHSTLDYKIYKQYVEQGMDAPASIHTSLMRRLHDHSITDSLMEEIEGEKVVAIMGGHGMERRDPVYFIVAKIARTLTQKGFLLISGGGPGAMEATHLGAYFACRSEDELRHAIDMMKTRPADAKPNTEYDDKDWLNRAWKVREAYPLSEQDLLKCKSIGIPTWLYGHEPPSLFATRIAKYFANSVREDGLLQIAKHGVIFAPGSAGTIQEIFQDACQNHYAPYNRNPDIERFVSPMILFGRDIWTREKPVWDLLKKVSSGTMYSELLALTDNEDEIINRVISYDPEAYKV